MNKIIVTKDTFNKLFSNTSSMQQGGTTDSSQVIQAYSTLTGQDPNEVMQQLQQMPPDQQQAAIQQMMQAIQQGQGQQQASPDQSQTQGGQPTMQQGGMYNQLPYHQTVGTVNTNPTPTTDPVTGQPIVNTTPYTINTMYNPTVAGYDVTGQSVLNQPTLSNVEAMQHYTGKGYGQKMADIEKTIGTHNWYFDTEAKKKAFREAAMKPDSGGAVKDFQSAYNQELTRRGKEAGLNQEQIGKAIGDIGFTGTGVQQLDDKFGAFTSTRPIFSFSKTASQPQTEPTPATGTVPRDVVKSIVPTEGMPYVMPPSAPIAPYLQQVDLSRLEGQKGSVENQLQASENARQAAYEATKGLPPAQAAAMMANYLSTSGQQDTQGIAAQEQQDLGNKARVEQYNAGQSDKEKLLNEQLKKQYEREAFGTLNVNEQNWRNYYDVNEANRQTVSSDIDRLNAYNAMLTHNQLTGRGVEFVNQSPFQQTQSDPRFQAIIDALPPEQRMAYEKALTAKNQVAAGNVVDLSQYKK